MYNGVMSMIETPAIIPPAKFQKTFFKELFFLKEALNKLKLNDFRIIQLLILEF
jgi:hypothetical protein